MDRDKIILLGKVITSVIIFYSIYSLCVFMIASLFDVVVGITNPILFFYLYVFVISITIYLSKQLLKNELINSTIRNESFAYRLTFSVILLGLSFYFIVTPLTEFIPFEESNLNEVVAYMQQNNFMIILLSIIIGPILEEYLFRGILLKSLLVKYSPILSILITSFLFSIMHINLGLPIDSFLFAIIVGWVFVKAKSIIPCIILHSVYNGLAQLQKQFTLSKENNLLSSSELIGNDFLYYSLCFISFLFFIGTITWINKNLVPNEKST